MKAYVQRCFFLCASLGALTAHGQITITSADVTSQFAVGNTLTYRFDTLTTSVNIGAPGASSWNFSFLRSDSVQALTSVALSSVPSSIRNQFPGTSYAMRASLTFQGLSGTAYQFFTLSGDLLNPGFGARDNGTGFLILTSKNNPTELFYKLPSTLGTLWRTTFTTTLALNGSALSTTTHDATYVVDAYGPMTFPGGAVHEALRIRKTDIINGTPVRSFIFLARNAASVIITACDTNVISGTITHCGSNIQWSSPINTDVQASGDLPSGFALEQNYPNPISAQSASSSGGSLSTTIRFSVPQASVVSLKVFNALGQEVAQLVAGEHATGAYAVRWNANELASGVYYYRLTAGGVVQTKRMVVVR
ncbi:MAG: hypothetical protein C4326_07885 [Ignavibacteria bacterium]